MFKQTVVAQHYPTDVYDEYVIRGNSAILKCQIPSFVADFVDVISWQTNENISFFPDNIYGVSIIFAKIKLNINLSQFPSIHFKLN